MTRLGRPRDELMHELRNAYERGASIRALATSAGLSYGSVHGMLRDSGAAMRGRGGANHRRRPS